MATRMRKITQTPEGREEWLGWRRDNINASEAGALLGVDKYRTPLALYYEKFGDLVTEETDAMRRGRWLEPAVIKAVADTHPEWEVVPRAEYFDDPGLRVGCTPDAFITDKKTGRKGVLQAKTVNERVFQEWCADGPPKAPTAYEVQTVVESMQTLRMDFAILGTLVVGYRCNLQVFPVPVHEGAWQMFLKRTKAFWADAKKGIAPPVTGPDEELIKKLYPMPDGSIIDLSGDDELAKLLDMLMACNDLISSGNKARKPIEEKQKTIRTQIRARMGAAEMAILPNGLQATLKMIEEKQPRAYRKLHIKELKE